MKRGRTPVLPSARTVPPLRPHPRGHGAGEAPGRVSVKGLAWLQPGARSHLCYRIRVHRGRKGERGSMSEADTPA